MSQSIVWTVAKDTTTRVATDGSPTQGSGTNKRLYVGRKGSFDYKSYLLPAPVWTNVGKIVSAILTLYTDDDLGTEGKFTGATPKVYVRRLTSAFTEGNDADFTASDYTTPSLTSADGFSKAFAADPLGVNNIDVTAMIEDIAPASVKRRNGTPGGAATFHGFRLSGTTDTDERWGGVSSDAEAGLAAYEPYLTLTYEYGVTVPDTPGTLTPSGAQTSLDTFGGTFSDIKATDQLRFAEVEIYPSTATNAGQTVTGTKLYPLAQIKQAQSAAAIAAAVFEYAATGFTPVVNTTYKWRARVWDQEGQASLWTDLVSFSVTNTVPTAPVLSPVGAYSAASLDQVTFKGGEFADPDVGDTLRAYQVQLSAYPEGDAHWLDDEFILWNTGKTYTPSGATNWATPYGGANLAAGTYYWRARQWDNHDGVSAWSYASIVLTTDFVVEAQSSTGVIQIRPKAAWRIIIRDMGALRGPGNVVAIIEDAYNVGASVLYNSPGEAHWTLGVNHPQISVIEPKQTHYAIEFRQGDGWREVFAGLVFDIDASDRDIIFYGIDYLAILNSIVDEHYDANNTDLPAESGGSKYVTAGKNNIGYIVRDQLARAIAQPNSPLGFMTINQSAGTLAALFPETLTVWSTYQTALPFIVGLLNSHRGGTTGSNGMKRSRLSVRKKTAGGYEFYFADDPGTVRDNLRMRFGELVQGYRVIPFGNGWATRVNGFGRDKDGVLVRYKSVSADSTGALEALYGRWMRPVFYDGISDANDLTRKVTADAIAGAKLGHQVGLGLRSGVLQPRDGYDICDVFPIDIQHGAIDTSNFGSGYWAAVGITWTALQQGDLNTIITFSPREDTELPSGDLLTLSPISPQAEWQIGWTSPAPTATARFWLDQTTGITYQRIGGTLIATTITGSV